MIIKAKNKLLRKKAKEAKKPKADGVDETPDAENEDHDLNIAWRSNEYTEDNMFNEDDFDTDTEDTKLLEAMDNAVAFIEAADQI